MPTAQRRSGQATVLPAGVSASWLRASCPCPSCLDPGSGQRLVNITDQPAEVRFGSVTEDASSYVVTYEPDGHRAMIAKSWLAAALAGALGPAAGAAGRTEDAKRLWLAADFAAGPPLGSWDLFTTDPTRRASCLDALLTDGFVLLRDVPARSGMVLRVAASMGYVRETNYGKLFDVRTRIDPANLAFTSLAIAPHTDNPYRDPVPTVQLLHCLASAAEGGDSGLVDGFRAAGLLRDEDPAAFDVLTSTPVTFRYAAAAADLQATMPMIGLDPRGRVREVRFNNRSLQPLGSPSGALEPSSADAFYRAYRAFAQLLARPELMLTFRLEPGDCVAFDNTRVLHARTAFTAGTGPGHRHLQGCYADLDGVASALALLRREDQIPNLRGTSTSMTHADPVAQIAELFSSEGAGEYLGEPVTQAAHMLQAAHLAEQEGADDALVAAALLHDVGHFKGAIGGQELMSGTDNLPAGGFGGVVPPELPAGGFRGVVPPELHSHSGADWLAQWFGPEVTEPVRLHVAAKRYLCAVEPGYAQTLSPASVYTLGVQGGPMRGAELAEFAASPYADDACRLRRWDDAAKDPDAAGPPFDHFRQLLTALVRV